MGFNDDCNGPQPKPGQEISQETLEKLNGKIAEFKDNVTIPGDEIKRNMELLGNEQEEETIKVKPQILYGISIFFLSNGKPHVDVTGEPTMLELQMLLGPALANVEGDIVAEKAAQKLLQVMLDTRKKSNTIITP